MPAFTRRLRGVVLVLAALGAVAGPGAATALAASQTATVTLTIRDTSGGSVTSVPAGMTVHPMVQVSGFSGTPTGNVTISEWHNGTCAGSVATSYGNALSGGLWNATTEPYTPQAPGGVSYKAVYFGDATYFNNASACVGATVTKANPAVALQFKDSVFQLINGTVGFGVPIHPLVTIYGAAGYATGLVDVERWSLPGCSGSSAVQWGLVLSNGKVEASTQYAWTPPTPGKYFFSAHYEGDSTYNAKSSSCVTISVDRIDATMFSKLMANGQDAPAAVTLGSDVYANVQLEGAQGLGTPTGTVSVSRYLNTTCSGSPDDSEGMPAAEFLNPAGTPVSQASPVQTSWRVTYSGDTRYNPLTGTCLQVAWKASSQLSIVAEDKNGIVVSQPPVGTDLHPRVTASGAYGTPGGQVTMRWYLGGSCSGGTLLGTRTLSGGVVDDKTLHVLTSVVGFYSFQATYTGNGTYFPSTSSCVQVNVTPAAPGSTPVPTAPPSTPAPTNAPGATPANPGATSAPTGAPQGSAAPGDTTAPDASSAASTVPDSGSSQPAGTDAGPTAAADATDGAAFGGPTGPVSPSASAGGLPSWLIVALVVAVLVVGFGAFAARRRREPAEA